MTDYPAPVASLLQLGEKPLREKGWLDYLGMGIGPEHIPDLIRLVKKWIPEDDEKFDRATAPPWAPVHAWRALAQLHAGEATETLVEVLRREMETDCSDWAISEMPFVFGELGPSALPGLAWPLQNAENDSLYRWNVAEGIEEIGRRHPEARGECVALLAAQLEKASEQEGDFNGGLIAGLLDLKAVEAAPIIERAFAAGAVDEWIAGDWETVRYELGLGPPPAPKRPPSGKPVPSNDPRPSTEPTRSPRSRAEERSRNRKLLAKKSKKKNRKKK